MTALAGDVGGGFVGPNADRSAYVNKLPTPAKSPKSDAPVTPDKPLSTMTGSKVRLMTSVNEAAHSISLLYSPYE